MKLKNLVPMLNVDNIEASIHFYQTALDFSIVSDPNAVKEWRWATIRSGDTELMLAETEAEINLKMDVDPHHNINWPVLFYFYPDDVSELHAHVISKGFEPTKIITTIYGMREFSIQDPDGHMLSFGEDADS